MNYNDTSKQKMKKLLGRLLIIEIFVCYITILTVISHARGPEKYQRDKTNQEWTALDFSCLDDAGLSNIQENMLHMENTISGHNITFQTKINIAEMDGLHISFLIDCPSDYLGTHLAVDLFNEEAGYDEGSMEYMHTLSEGRNEIVCELFPQENAPNTVFMRIFTSDLANYNVQSLQIYPLYRMEKVSVGMVLTLFLVVAATVIAGVTFLVGPGEGLLLEKRQ